MKNNRNRMMLADFLGCFEPSIRMSVSWKDGDIDHTVKGDAYTLRRNGGVAGLYGIITANPVAVSVSSIIDCETGRMQVFVDTKGEED